MDLVSNLIENHSCACGHPLEDLTYFLLNCSIYAAIRIELGNNVTLISRVTTAVLLNGNTELCINEHYCEQK